MKYFVFQFNTFNFFICLFHLYKFIFNFFLFSFLIFNFNSFLSLFLYINFFFHFIFLLYFNLYNYVCNLLVKLFVLLIIIRDPISDLRLSLLKSYSYTTQRFYLPVKTRENRVFLTVLKLDICNRRIPFYCY